MLSMFVGTQSVSAHTPDSINTSKPDSAENRYSADDTLKRQKKEKQ